MDETEVPTCAGGGHCCFSSHLELLGRGEARGLGWAGLHALVLVSWETTASKGSHCSLLSGAHEVSCLLGCFTILCLYRFEPSWRLSAADLVTSVQPSQSMQGWQFHAGEAAHIKLAHATEEYNRQLETLAVGCSTEVRVLEGQQSKPRLEFTGQQYCTYMYMLNSSTAFAYP